MYEKKCKHQLALHHTSQDKETYRKKNCHYTKPINKQISIQTSKTTKKKRKTKNKEII